MNGSPAKLGSISGTSSHSSALKMREQELASALKYATKNTTQASYGNDVSTEEDAPPPPSTPKKPYVKKGGKATGSMKDYKIGSKERYAEYEARGWAQDDTTKGGKPTSEKLTKQQEVEAKGDIKKDNIAKKAAKRTGEVVENVSKKTAKISKKEARKKYGRGSKEHLAAKQAHLEAKVIDIQGGKGGRKRGLFRGLATKINLKRQKKNQAKIDAAKEAE